MPSAMGPRLEAVASSPWAVHTTTTIMQHTMGRLARMPASAGKDLARAMATKKMQNVAKPRAARILQLLLGRCVCVRAGAMHTSTSPMSSLLIFLFLSPFVVLSTYLVNLSNLVSSGTSCSSTKDAAAANQTTCMDCSFGRSASMMMASPAP